MFIQWYDHLYLMEHLEGAELQNLWTNHLVGVGGCLKNKRRHFAKSMCNVDVLILFSRSCCPIVHLCLLCCLHMCLLCWAILFFEAVGGCHAIVFCPWLLFWLTLFFLPKMKGRASANLLKKIIVENNCKLNINFTMQRFNWQSNMQRFWRDCRDHHRCLPNEHSHYYSTLGNWMLAIKHADVRLSHQMIIKTWKTKEDSRHMIRDQRWAVVVTTNLAHHQVLVQEAWLHLQWWFKCSQIQQAYQQQRYSDHECSLGLAELAGCLSLQRSYQKLGVFGAALHLLN